MFTGLVERLGKCLGPPQLQSVCETPTKEHHKHPSTLTQAPPSPNTPPASIPAANAPPASPAANLPAPPANTPPASTPHANTPPQTIPPANAPPASPAAANLHDTPPPASTPPANTPPAPHANTPPAPHANTPPAPHANTPPQTIPPAANTPQPKLHDTPPPASPAAENYWKIRIEAPAFANKLKLGESIAVNGCCLSVEAIQGDTLTFALLNKTLRHTHLGALQANDSVHLERALRAGDRLGGHYLSGHIDAALEVLSCGPACPSPPQNHPQNHPQPNPSHSPESQADPHASQNNSPESQADPHASQNNSPESQTYPSPSQNNSPESQACPSPPQADPHASQNNSPESQTCPSPAEDIHLSVELPERFKSWIVPEGSVAIDGVSLTVAACTNESFSVCLIPHTLQNTHLGTLHQGDKVNVEFDTLAKHIASALQARGL